MTRTCVLALLLVSPALASPARAQDTTSRSARTQERPVSAAAPVAVRRPPKSAARAAAVLQRGIRTPSVTRNPKGDPGGTGATRRPFALPVVARPPKDS